MMSTEVYTSVNVTSRPTSYWWNDEMNMRDDGSTSRTLYDGRLLKHTKGDYIKLKMSANCVLDKLG